MLGRGPTAGDADPSSSKPAPEKGTAAAAAAAGQSIIRAGGAESQTEYATIAATAAARQSTIRAGGAESQTEYAAIAATAAAGQSLIRAWGAESQTEYAAIPPKAKKRDRDALTDRQREVRQRQRQGDRLQEEQTALGPLAAKLQALQTWHVSRCGQFRPRTIMPGWSGHASAECPGAGLQALPERALSPTPSWMSLRSLGRSGPACRASPTAASLRASRAARRPSRLLPRPRSHLIRPLQLPQCRSTARACSPLRKLPPLKGRRRELREARRRQAARCCSIWKPGHPMQLLRRGQKAVSCLSPRHGG